MMCAFSNKLCEECALYRGRHYYLCFCKKYRGYLGEPKDVAGVFTRRVGSNRKLEIPVSSSAIDPFATTPKGIKKEV